MKPGLMKTFFLAVIAIISSFGIGCSESSNIETPEKPYVGEYEGAEEPRKEKQYYSAILKNVPLDVAELEQDLSDTDTVINSKAWVVDMYYSYNNGSKDIYVLFSNNHLYRIDGERFTMEWTVNLYGRPTCAPSISDKFVYWLTDKHRLVWYYRDRQVDGIQKKHEMFLQVIPGSPIAANDSSIFFGAQDNFRVFAHTEQLEYEKWSWPQDRKGTGSVTMAPHADRDRVYFYANNGYLYCVSGEDGSTNWKRDINHMSANLMMKNDFLFVPAWDSKLYCLDKSNRVIWYFPAGEIVVSTPFVEDRYVIFQTPRYMKCIQYNYVRAGGASTADRWIRLTDEESGRRADQVIWQIPLLPEKYLKGFTDMGEDKLASLKERKKYECLMKGTKWLYLLERLGDKKFIRRVDIETGAMDPKSYDVTAFPYICGSHYEQDRSIYLGTREGYIMALREPID